MVTGVGEWEAFRSPISGLSLSLCLWAVNLPSVSQSPPTPKMGQDGQMGRI